MSANDSDCKLLLHCDGADEHTTFTDDSVGGNGGANHAVTANGTAKGDTAQKKFGSASLLLDGDSDYLSIGDHADFNFSTDPFTIDMWVRFNSLDLMCLISQYTDGNNNWLVYYQSSQLQFTADNAGDPLACVASWTPSLNTWYHIALIRNWGSSANVFALCLNGIAVGTSEKAFTMPDLADDIEIGRVDTTGYFDGWIDEIRVVKGVARWTANFEVPSGPYPNSADEWMGTVNGVVNPAKVNGATAAALYDGSVAGVSTYQ